MNPSTRSTPPVPPRLTTLDTMRVRRRRATVSESLSVARKVDDICQFMLEKDLRLEDFIRVYETTQPSDGYTDRPATRTEWLADAVNTQLEAVKALWQYPASGSVGIIPRRRCGRNEGAGRGQRDFQCLSSRPWTTGRCRYRIGESGSQ